MNKHQLLQELKELRRQAGYEPNSWYEQKEEEVLLEAFKEIESEERERIISKLEERNNAGNYKLGMVYDAICALKEERTK